MKRLLIILSLLFVSTLCFAENKVEKYSKLIDIFYNKGNCVIVQYYDDNEVSKQRFITKSHIAQITVYDDEITFTFDYQRLNVADYSFEDYEFYNDDYGNLIIQEIE